jgi:uncharacterized LabA/DUF88 family protein
VDEIGIATQLIEERINYMTKIMVFIDGTWLYANRSRLSQLYGENFQMDYGKLPNVLASEVSQQLGSTDVDVVRTYLFGSYASNYDPKDEPIAVQRLDFYEMLKEEFLYEVKAYPINYFGHPLKRSEWSSNDPFQPKEKCVDISLATTMLCLAAIPYAYDIAIAVLGDQDFKPLLQSVRQLGKRVAIASIRGSCAADLADPHNNAKVRDFEMIWLDALLDQLQLKYERQQRECQSATHVGDRTVWSDFRPRKGQRFYCDECRANFEKQKQRAIA